MFREDADVELSGFESDDAFAVSCGLSDEVAHLSLSGDQISPHFSERGFGGPVAISGGLQLGHFLGVISQASAAIGDALSGGRLFRISLRLGPHTLPIGEALGDFGILSLVFSEFLGSGFAFRLQLGQGGFSGGDAGFGGLHRGFRGSERWDEFGEALLECHKAVGDLSRIAGDLDDLATSLAFEEADLAQPVAGDEGLRVVEADDFGDLVSLLDSLRMLETLAVDGPHRGGAVGTAGEEATVWQEGDGLHVAAMGAPGGDLLAGLHLPGGDDAIGGTAGQDVRVGAPGEVGNAALMLAEIIEFPAVIGFPDENIAVAVSRREQDAVRTKVGASHPLGVLGNQVELLARSDVKALHLLGIGREDDLSVVRRDVGRHHLVELFADLGDALAGLDVPDDGVADFATTATAHDQQRTVGAELQRAGITFGIGQDTGEVVRVGVVEENLLLSGDRKERGPGARRHGDDG